MSLILKYDLGNPHRLPVGYTPLAYIESSGTLYIDPGSTFNSTSVRSFKLIFLDTIGNWVYGTNSSGPKEVLIGVRSYLGGGFDTPNLWKLNELYDVQISTITGAMYMRVNGETVRTSTGLANGFKEWLFADGKSDNTINVCRKWRLYNYKIWDNNVLVKDFIPAKNSSGVIGLFDCVSQTFFTNQGTGSFIAGPEVTVLPYEYLLVEYLHSDGNQYINTGYIPGNNNLVIDMIGTTDTNAPSTNRSFYGGASSGVWNPLFNVCNGHWEVGFGGYWAVGTIPSTGGYYITKLTATNGTNQTFVVNGETLVNNGSRSYTATNGPAWFLFKINNSFPIIGSIHYMKITENGTVVREYIPCYRRSDLKPGMYDTVNNVFYTNSGAGEFILGPVVEESSRLLEYNNAGSNYIGKPINIHHSTSNPSTTQINEGSGDFNNSVIVLNGGLPTTSKTICFWMYLASIPGTTIVYMDSNTGSCFSIDSQVNIGASTAKGSYNKSILKVGWQHITIDLLNWNLYVDGILLTKNSGSGYYNPTNGNNLNIGKRIYNGTNDYPFNGCLYDFRVYDNVLTADEVLQIYKRGL